MSEGHRPLKVRLWMIRWKNLSHRLNNEWMSQTFVGYTINDAMMITWVTDSMWEGHRPLQARCLMIWWWIWTKDTMREAHRPLKVTPLITWWWILIKDTIKERSSQTSTG